MLAADLTNRYEVPVLPVSCMELSENEIKRVLAQLLFEFPIREIKVDIPEWVVKLGREHWLKSKVFEVIQAAAQPITKTREIQQAAMEMAECDYISSAEQEAYRCAELLKLQTP